MKKKHNNFVLAYPPCECTLESRMKVILSQSPRQICLQGLKDMKSNGKRNIKCHLKACLVDANGFDISSQFSHYSRHITYTVFWTVQNTNTYVLSLARLIWREYRFYDVYFCQQIPQNRKKILIDKVHWKTEPKRLPVVWLMY